MNCLDRIYGSSVAALGSSRRAINARFLAEYIGEQQYTQDLQICAAPGAQQQGAYPIEQHPVAGRKKLQQVRGRQPCVWWWFWWWCVCASYVAAPFVVMVDRVLRLLLL